jgi:hypothetical protein
MDKQELTKKFMDQLELPKDDKNFRKHYTLWWANPRKSKPKSLRLTDVGYKMLKEQIQLKSYEIAFTEDTEWTAQLILHLDKFLESPYYLDRKTIMVFREKTAVELMLFSGDLQKFGLAKAMSQKNNANTD